MNKKAMNRRSLQKAVRFSVTYGCGPTRLREIAPTQISPRAAYEMLRKFKSKHAKVLGCDFREIELRVVSTIIAKSQKVCSECGGKGKFYSHIDADKDEICKRCKGTGKVKKGKHD